MADVGEEESLVDGDVGGILVGGGVGGALVGVPQVGVSVRIKFESERENENKSQANKTNDTVICFIEVRFLQTYSP